MSHQDEDFDAHLYEILVPTSSNQCEENPNSSRMSGQPSSKYGYGYPTPNNYKQPRISHDRSELSSRIRQAGPGGVNPSLQPIKGIVRDQPSMAQCSSTIQQSVEGAEKSPKPLQGNPLRRVGLGKSPGSKKRLASLIGKYFPRGLGKSATVTSGKVTNFKPRYPPTSDLGKNEMSNCKIGMDKPGEKIEENYYVKHQIGIEEYSLEQSHERSMERALEQSTQQSMEHSSGNCYVREDIAGNIDRIVISGNTKYLDFDLLQSKMNKRPGKSRSNVGNTTQRSNEKLPDGPPVELENQFVMRLPDSEAATALRKAIESGASNLKERLFIQLEPDKTSNNQYLRKGRVQFDGWNFTSRLVDLPTIIESHKTIDNKTLYKTADICQLLICKEGDEFEKEDASPSKKRRDPNKVDKKFLYPHGIGPPLKNCRKRRFRKTLKKKYVEAPEIEKEVKRLLRTDNEALTVNWEVITENELNANKGGEAGKDNPDVHPSQSGVFTNDPKDLGLDLSDSEDETRDIDIDSEDNSRLSAGDDSRMSDSLGPVKHSSPVQAPLQFSREMFQQPAVPPPPFNQRSAQEQELKQELMLLRARMKELEHNISSCPNISLKEKFKQEVRDIKEKIKEKEGM